MTVWPAVLSANNSNYHYQNFRESGSSGEATPAAAYSQDHHPSGIIQHSGRAARGTVFCGLHLTKIQGGRRGFAGDKHCEFDPAALKPYYNALDKQTEEREALYCRRNPPGALIPSNARRTSRADHRPLNDELR